MEKQKKITCSFHFFWISIFLMLWFWNCLTMITFTASYFRVIGFLCCQWRLKKKNLGYIWSISSLILRGKFNRPLSLNSFLYLFFFFLNNHSPNTVNSIPFIANFLWKKWWQCNYQVPKCKHTFALNNGKCLFF